MENHIASAKETKGDEEHPTGDHAAQTSKVLLANNQIVKLQWRDSEGRAHGIILNKQREAKERDLLVKSLSEYTKLLNRIYRRSQAKSKTLEKLVPHLGTLESIKQELKVSQDAAKAKERQLMDKIGQLQNTNLEYHGSIGGKQILPAFPEKTSICKL
ncbi:hypothetical protein OsJ_06568 [Oryza sativa Japonica Group]|uniref:Uncharacterized protein n=1 Tax=Oryza sativa subsp. japonica TaxID=39947 RepID=A3A6E3_ORYSJ|nr:hypothetical protein OsJ_06568 [Oryza sativa Japonica Group]